MIYCVEKVVGWSPLRWNRQRPVVYPTYNPTLSFIINSYDMSKLEDRSMFGDCRIWLEILAVCWEFGKDADNVSPNDPKNEFDA